MKLSKPRHILLSWLHKRGGMASGKLLTIPDRRLASKMQSDGLVSWEPPKRSRAGNLDDWTLHLTVGGREALGL